jgi:hypothetical protein
MTTARNSPCPLAKKPTVETVGLDAHEKKQFVTSSSYNKYNVYRRPQQIAGSLPLVQKADEDI